QEPLSSENTTLISPVAVSQMIDENKSKGNWPPLPLQSMSPQPSAYHPQQSLAHRVSVNIHRAFEVPSSRLKIQASLGDTKVPSTSPTTEKKRCQKQKKGFASITVTARRVAASSGDPARALGAVQEPSAASHTSSTVLHHWLPAGHANQGAYERPQKRLFDPANKENNASLQGSDGRGKAPPSFTSCVHLQVSQQCPNTVYYLDKSLVVCVGQPRVKSQNIHRSVLSFTLHCSSSRVTADGVDGIANGEPRAETPQPKLLEGKKTPLGSTLSADLTASRVFNKEKASGVCLGRKYPSPSVFTSALPALVNVPGGPHKVVTARTDNAKHPGSCHTAVSLRLPNASEDAGTRRLEHTKNRCTMVKCSAMASRSLPDITSSEDVIAATDGPLKKKDPSKDTSKSKEIQAQRILIPKMFLSRSMCNLKASSRILSEEIVPRQKQLLKSDYEFHGSSDKRKEREEEEEEAWERASGVTLSTARSPDVTCEKNCTFTCPENSSQPEKTPPAPQTLREALEIHNPQFITRSQERLKKLEHMVQLRKSQQSDAPAGNHGTLLRKLSSASTSSKKRQYTIPHPLSGKL
ncbi:CJ090 protein, partial [Upupa epops]|nr:CJ090 protein [Upupa epops]